MKLLCIITLFLGMNLFSQETIKIGEVTNNISMGPLAGNRDLAFGVKNILEEILQDKGLDLDPNSNKSIQIELFYFDVMKNSMQLGGFGRQVDVTLIAAGANLWIDGKVVKSVTAKESSKSISTATLIIDKGGKFSQTGVSIALKKVCEQLIEKLKL